MIKNRKNKKSGMQSLILVAIIALVYVFYSRTSSEVKTYVDHEGKEQFQITVTTDLIVEIIQGRVSEESKEASADQGIYVYFNQKKEDSIYFYIVDSDRTYDDILGMRPGSDIEVTVLDTGELYWKKDTQHKRVYGNIHFSLLGYGAYFDMSEELYNKHHQKIEDIINSYRLKVE